jgi:hypothetical protein
VLSHFIVQDGTNYSGWFKFQFCQELRRILLLEVQEKKQTGLKKQTDPAEYFTGNSSNLCQAMPPKSQDERQP